MKGGKQLRAPALQLFVRFLYFSCRAGGPASCGCLKRASLTGERLGWHGEAQRQAWADDLTDRDDSKGPKERRGSMHKATRSDGEGQTTIISHNAGWQIGGPQANPCQHQLNNSSCISVWRPTLRSKALIGPTRRERCNPPACPRVVAHGTDELAGRGTSGVNGFGACWWHG